MTPGCTTQAQCLRNSKDALDERNVVVLGVSPDAVKRLPKFIEKENFNFTLLSDEDHAFPIGERFTTLIEQILTTQPIKTIMSKYKR